jgi:hypothetical protein
MTRLPTFTFVLMIAAAVVSRSAAQERGPIVTPQPITNGQQANGPMSIFNDKVRRFRFELEETLITAETAEEFVVRHQARNKPPIIGAFADSETNSLVVIGPPEAEQPVRETLATWLVDRQAGGRSTLAVQRRTLEFRRGELLRIMAGVEVLLVAATGDKAKQLRDRLQIFEDELTVVEKQMEVVDRYAQRLQNKGAATVGRTETIATDRSSQIGH